MVIDGGECCLSLTSPGASQLARLIGHSLYISVRCVCHRRSSDFKFQRMFVIDVLKPAYEQCDTQGLDRVQFSTAAIHMAVNKSESLVFP